ncbi:major capsid family protein [Pasteurella multocida]|uniref:major capsid family protein n=1 Tax=Pasteurella multocida TaxID=747 RepID=UPI000BBCFE54|nr:major capsid family protein [Pasteurella multocida]ATF73906.1 hypothetical protein CO688_00280 [Pasteurella multocida]ATN16308.1 DUF2184 domain-containing protein [Pasteurella multocida]HDR1207030.1 DUF2184 domain-containing protein [Pasteurella multocida]HDR1386024.1 DUF2184 domain-containing protein [Pasteurella multocida]
MAHINVLRSALTEVQEGINRTKYPDIVFPKFVFINSEGSELADEILSFSSDVTGDLDNGLISMNTSVFDQVGVTFNHKKVPLVTWMKLVEWHEYELKKAAALGVKVNTEKLYALNQNAHQTLQKVAFLGHGQDARLKGLLTSSEVEVYTPTKATGAVSAMDYAKAVTFFEELFLKATEKTHRIAVPNTFAIDSADRAHLALLERPNSDKTALEWLQEKLTGAAGKEVKIEALPSNFGKLANAAQSKTRAIVYTNDKNYVEMNIPKSPTVIGAGQKDLVTYQSGLTMVFGGVNFKEPQSAIYVDY